MKQNNIGFLTFSLCLALLYVAAPSLGSAAETDMTGRRNVYECQKKASEYTYNLDKAGDTALYEKHLQDCLEVARSKKDAPPKGVAVQSGASVTTVKISNMRGKQIKVYLGFNTDSCYQPNDFSGFCKSVDAVGNRNICAFDLPAAETKSLEFDRSKAGNICKASFVITADALPWTGCAVTQAEFTIRDFWDFNKKFMDTYDISLVNGFNGSVGIVPSAGSAAGPVTNKLNNQNAPYTFPFACDTCTGNKGAPESCKNDPDYKDSQCKPTHACQYSVENTGANTYTVNLMK